MKYGLIGKSVNKSFSSEIHYFFGVHDYSLISMNKEQFIDFVKERNFLGINITSPYKKDIIHFLDEVDELAKECQSVNTVVNINGKLKGYNTDYYGLDYLLRKNNIIIKDKNVLVLGTGGVSSTVHQLMMNLGARSCYFASRNKKEYLSYQDIYRFDFNIIINASLMGRSIDNDDLLIDLSRFKKVEAVIDLNYNPLKPRLLQSAESLNINAFNGLDMLIEQARLADQLFLSKKIDENLNKQVASKIIDRQSNIVLLGMPYSGKSTIGKLLAKELNKEFIDIDEIFMERYGDISLFFKTHSEDDFRKIESSLIREFGFKNNAVIASGGGAIKNEENIRYLRQNSIIFYLYRNPETIAFDGTRPLCLNISDYNSLLNNRLNKYLKYSDYQIHNVNVNDTIIKIKEKYYEAISD